MKPYKFQLEALDEIDGFGGRSLVGHEMGLGKTLITLWWLERNRKKALPALIVCPASLKLMWKHEADRTLGVNSIVLSGRKPRQTFVPEGGLSVTIINYDIIQYWQEDLQKRTFKTIVLEECHACKNPKTKRTKAIRQLAKKIPHILALSGTPLTNRPIELFPVLNMIRPHIFKSLWEFGMRYCGGKKGYWGYEFKGATKTAELHGLLKSSCMTRRLKSEVLTDLPKKNRCIIPVPMHSPEEYWEAENDFITWLAKQDLDKAKRALMSQTLVQLGYLKRLAAKLKARYVVEWINEWLINNGEQKIILFAEHKAMLRVLEKRCKAKWVTVEGSTPIKKRQKFVEQFQEDPKTRMFIANRAAGGTGLTLTAASTLVFTELDWVPANHVQAEDRIHRIGQKEVAWIYYFVGIGSLEEKLCAVIQKKQEVLNAVLDGKPKADNLNVHDQLMKEYSKGILNVKE